MSTAANPLKKFHQVPFQGFNKDIVEYESDEKSFIYNTDVKDE